ncbi:hypothetical protein K2X89_03235 [Myxococcota bacterium]|nr:hypothetical protein [Myxococcota bacterium]
MNDPILPMIDFTRIPEEYEGLWVVLRVGSEQRILGSGRTVDQAMQSSGVSSEDPRIALTKVPVAVPVVLAGSLGAE